MWLVRHQDTGAFCAAKLIEADGDALRFEREAELSARLTHRNLVRVFDYVREENGQAALIMEHLRGETVEDVLHRHGQLPASAAVALVVAVLRGVEHAHSRGIVHRDLKPANIFLAVEPDGLVIPKILDFGIAKSIESEGSILLTQQGHVLGTPAYMSPEQVRGEPVGPASDVFSLGVLLYELLTGELVFRAPSAHAAMLAILEREAAQHASIPDDLWPVLERALAKSPADRWSSAEDMRAALQGCAAYVACDPDAALAALDLRVPPLPSTPMRRSEPSYPPLELPKPNLVAAPLPIPGLSRGPSPRAIAWALVAAAVLVLTGTSLFGRGTPLAAATPDPQLARVPAAPPSIAVVAVVPEPSALVAKPHANKSATQKTLAAKLGPTPPTDARPTASPAAKPKRH